MRYIGTWINGSGRYLEVSSTHGDTVFYNKSGRVQGNDLQCPKDKFREMADRLGYERLSAEQARTVNALAG